MDLTPKLLAAADMCAAGEEVNLDELAFLLRYAADERRSATNPDTAHDQLLQATRTRLTARAELLHLPPSEVEAIADADVPTLLALDERLDSELARRFPPEVLADIPLPTPDVRFAADRFRSGPDAMASAR